MPRAQTICCDMPRRNSSPSAIAPPTPLCMPHKTAQTATRAAARCVCVRDLLSFRLSIGDHSPISCQTDSRKNASAPIYSVLSSSVLVCWLSGWVISYHISSFFKFCKFRATLILPLFLPQKKILAMTLLLHQGKNPFHISLFSLLLFTKIAPRRIHKTHLLSVGLHPHHVGVYIHRHSVAVSAHGHIAFYVLHHGMIL